MPHPGSPSHLDPLGYLERQPPQHRRALLQLRATILDVAPGCEEAIRRRVPAYLLDGRQLVSIGAARAHVSLYVMYGDALEHLAERLRGLDVSTTVVRFDPARPIPTDVVNDVVAFRAREIRGLPTERLRRPSRGPTGRSGPRGRRP